MKHTLSDVIDEYLESRRRQYAANTVKNDAKALRELLAVIGNIQVANIEVRHIDTLWAKISTRLQPSTINSYNASLRAFFTWCRQRRVCRPDHDPMLGRRFLKVPPKHKVRVPADQFGQILDAAGHPADRALVALGLYLFLRQGEIATLRVGDLDLTNSEIKVRVHKTTQIDVMPVSSELDREMRRWLTHYTTEVGPLDPDYFLVPAKSRPGFTGRAGAHGFEQTKPPRLAPTKKIGEVHVAVRRVLESSGHYVEGEAGHMLRRSGARALYDRLASEGHDRAARRVQAMLHHSTLTMTERYLGIDIDVKERNDLLKGKSMFPTPENVTELRRTGNGD